VPGDRTSEFRTASWDEALTLVVSKITELQAAYGPDAIGCFGGGGLTNEKAYDSASSPGSRCGHR
jgi:assimilatory nitrate reductase catalytic subunit